MIKYKSTEEINLMRQAGEILSGALKLADQIVVPGIETIELDNGYFYLIS